MRSKLLLISTPRNRNEVVHRCSYDGVLSWLYRRAVDTSAASLLSVLNHVACATCEMISYLLCTHAGMRIADFQELGYVGPQLQSDRSAVMKP